MPAPDDRAGGLVDPDSPDRGMRPPDFGFYRQGQDLIEPKENEMMDRMAAAIVLIAGVVIGPAAVAACPNDISETASRLHFPEMQSQARSMNHQQMLARAGGDHAMLISMLRTSIQQADAAIDQSTQALQQLGVAVRPSLDGGSSVGGQHQRALAMAMDARSIGQAWLEVARCHAGRR